MLLPIGAVEDLLEELRSQQLALQVQQAQQAQQAQQSRHLHSNRQDALQAQASQMALAELADQIFTGTDPGQADFQARLRDDFGVARSGPWRADGGRQAYM